MVLLKQGTRRGGALESGACAIETFLLFEIQMVTKIEEEEKDTVEVPDPPLPKICFQGDEATGR